MSFDTLGLSDKVVSAVKACGYTDPTPIQAEAIPHVLQRRDVLGLAQTGTGKTASFTLPMLTLLEKGRARARMPRTLILEPTRELAAQVEDNFVKYGVNHKLTVALLIGGVSFEEQGKKITRGADVLIATPGRLLDHVERGRLLLTGVEIVVIDEADRMLDMGFIPDIERIIKLIPFTRQTLLFSATMPPEISSLADRFLQNPTRVEVSKPASVVDTVNQSLVSSGSKPHEKRAVLRDRIYAAENLTNAIIFCNRKRDIATLARSLEKHGHSVGALHGDMDQHSRLKTLAGFRDNEITLLVASDVAARGLDIPTVSHVFNFDVPSHAEDYVHRIGRTGRAGRSGEAITIATSADRKYLAAIEKLIGTQIPQVGDARHAQTDDADANARKPRRGRGRKEKTAVEAAPETTEASSVARQDTRSDDTAAGEERAAREPQKRERKPREPKGRNAKSSEQDRKPKRERNNSRDNEPVGFGDQIPAFLLRPVRIAKEAESAEN